ncbi:MAG: hypothetical protein UR78_C0006G0002 [Candidatus Moranbacteria bacterium GW2011_GWF2_35_39]|uniref:Uncharacterized protein n=1 Tax=Candidatus Magasanikbacteria bacterium GW2011_GWE2_42_7 TaxID=1619052 RepID=A0A0G1B9N1_9BACT|nr:MAG: hypothetical protein UR78_C0006G0002 [Candidatus Moranbacteria bacterium GW2011_GWF2_35_39]KKS70080.1 MAG: hypothetical protein UV42_C0069G0003 [Candidatus Magasanikbacteria bacterium GW2011_GWE2_42_7]
MSNKDSKEEEKQFTFGVGGAGYIICPQCKHKQYHSVWWFIPCGNCKHEIPVVELYK